MRRFLHHFRSKANQGAAAAGPSTSSSHQPLRLRKPEELTTLLQQKVAEAAGGRSGEQTATGPSTIGGPNTTSRSSLSLSSSSSRPVHHQPALFKHNFFIRTVSKNAPNEQLQGISCGASSPLTTRNFSSSSSTTKKNGNKNPNPNDQKSLKQKFPREWAVFSTIDSNSKGYLLKQDLITTCEQIEVPEMADFLFELLDRNNDGVIDFAEVVANYKALTMVRNAARFRSWKRTFGLGVAGNVAGHMDQAGEGVEAAIVEDHATSSDATTSNDKPNLPPAVFAFYVPPLGNTTPEKVEIPKEFSFVRRKTPDVEQGEKETLQQKIKRLQRFPISNAVIHHPSSLGGASDEEDHPDADTVAGSKFQRVQVEPEIALFCEVKYKAQDALSFGSAKFVTELLPKKIAAFNDCSVRELEGSVKLSEKKNWGIDRINPPSPYQNGTSDAAFVYTNQTCLAVEDCRH
eukprot:GSA120T00013752001.1